MKQILLVFFMMVIVSGSAFAEEQYEKFGQGRVVFSQQQLTIDVEVAVTGMQRAIGLMFRENLGKNKGMLFDFGKDAIQRVWMKNTLIPLDILFISEKGKIVSILKNLQPCTKAPCVIFESEEPARYMLELNSGMSDGEKIIINQKMLLLL